MVDQTLRMVVNDLTALGDRELTPEETDAYAWTS